MGGVVIFMNCNNHSDMRSIVLLINHRERTIFIRTIMAAIVDDKLCTIYLIHEEPVQLFLPAAALMDMLPKNEFVMVSRSFKTFAAKGLMKDRFHYLQPAYNEVGEEAGKNVAAYWAEK